MLKPHNHAKLKGARGGAKGEGKPFFRASVVAGVFEILIYEEIGEYFDWSTYEMAGTTAKSVRESLDTAGPFSRIKVRINSPGGDAFEGVAIGNVLKSAGKPIDVFVDGIAASAASIIAMCGDTITVANNAMMMIHNAWSICMGEAADMLKMADTLSKISSSIAQTYVDRTGQTMDEIKALMDAESWLSADDCLKMGFATEISTANESAVAMARGFKVLNRMKAVPDSLKNAKNDDLDADDNANGCACDCEACQSDNCMDCSNANCEDADCKDCPMQSGAENSAELTAVAEPEKDETSFKRAKLAQARRQAA